MNLKIKSILSQLNRRNVSLLPKIKLNKYFKIILIILAVSFTVFTTKKIIAATTTVDLLVEDDTALKADNNLESWSMKATTTDLVHFFNITSGGVTVSTDSDSLNKTINYKPGGAIGALSNFIGPLYDMPVSGTQYIAKAKDEFLGVTYAAGFQELQPLIPIWKTIRNIVYVLSSVVFVVIGILIMLRVKISPQAVITIQNSIPKLITSLILVTFSYAIAGLVIDLSRVFLSLCLSVFFMAKGKGIDTDLFEIKVDPNLNFLSTIGDATAWFVDKVGDLFNIHSSSLERLSNMGFYELYSYVYRVIPGASSMALGEVVGQIITATILGGVGGALLGQAGQAAGTIAGGVTGDLVGGLLGGLLLPIILSLVVIFWLIKLYFGLLKCYLLVLFKIIISPIQIGMGAIPQAKASFSKWLIEIIAYVSVFPITTLFIVGLNYLCDIIGGSKGLWIPSQIYTATASGNEQVVAAGIALAGLGILSKLPKLIPEVAFQIKDSGFGSAIGESYAPIGKTAQFGGRAGAQYGADLVEKNYNEATKGPMASGAGKGLTFLNSMRKAATTAGIVKDKS